MSTSVKQNIKNVALERIDNLTTLDADYTWEDDHVKLFFNSGNSVKGKSKAEVNLA